MSLISNIKSYINESELKIIIYKNTVNIQNYDNILNFDSNKIVVIKNNKKISVFGVNLVTSKLMNDEILISGKIIKIELGDYNKK